MARALLYLDECVPVEVAVRMIADGYDVITARDADMLHATDDDQLEFAASRNRVLFTHDLEDFRAISRSWALLGRTHAGLVYSSYVPPATSAGWLKELFDIYSAEEIANCTLSVPLAD